MINLCLEAKDGFSLSEEGHNNEWGHDQISKLELKFAT
jgi:hypothetical protein